MKKDTVVSSKILSDQIIAGLQEKKGVEVLRMDLREVKGAVTDFFVICTGTSDRHCQALAESVKMMVKDEIGERPHNIEGLQKGEWILLDYISVVTHIFQKEKREFYRLEDLWGDAEFEEISDGPQDN